MAFWGVEVKPGKPFTHIADDARGRLHISQATLGIGTAFKKSVVQCNVGKKSPVYLCSLFPEKAESCQLNLEFEEADEVVFSVIGPRSVHLTGYFFGNSGQHYKLNDESESYGEDIADTETERSTGHSDEDKYDDSFINDDDPEVFPTSPVSDGGEIKDISDRRKSKNGKVYRRLRKKYQLCESDDDISAQKQLFANVSSAVTASDGESEDMLPIVTLCKDNPHKSKKIETEEKDVRKSVETNPATKLEAEEKTDNTSVEIGFGEAKDEGNSFTMSEGRSDVVSNGEPKRSEVYDSMLPPAEAGAENGVKTKKKRNVSKKVKHLDGDIKDCSNVLKEENAPQNDSETDKIKQNLPIPIEENQKTSNHVKNVDLPPDSLPHQIGSETDDKPKKRRRKERAGEKIFETDRVDRINVIEDKTVDKDVKHDSMGQDLPGNVEQNEKQATEMISENEVDQSVAKNQPKKEKKKKKKKRKRTEEDEKVINMEMPPLSMEPKSKSVMDTENSSAEGKLSQLRTLPNGLVIQELETGKPNGKVATSGKKISVHYMGKLKENGQVFDSNLGSTPLKFHLGRKDVVEGLNVGLEGMHVGEKRRLLIPPSMGYGSEGEDSKNIPPNSWLEFDVNLVKVHR